MYVLKESFIQALQQLVSNKLRSFLTLLGIAIGIFCIISVQSAVGSLESNVRNSFSRLGSDVIYIMKQPWTEDPGQNFWKYARRPNPGFRDYLNLKEHLTSAQSVAYSYFLGLKTIKWEKNAIERTFGLATNFEYDGFHNLEYEAGRYFSQAEYNSAANVIVLGSKVAEELFGEVYPIGQEVKAFGRRMTVVGVIKRSGKDIFKVYDYDNCIVIPFDLARNFARVQNSRAPNGLLQAKAAEGVTEQKLKDDITIQMRRTRQLKPTEEDNFALNSMTALQGPLNSIFGTLNLVGIFIGGFALLVGMFSVANIMFVSVKERTNIIGIKKALGAKKWVIALEFFIEAIVLCFIGGLLGLILVFGIISLLNTVSDFEMFVSWKNILTTFSISFVVGVISGLFPALKAANMDPVEAIRA